MKTIILLIFFIILVSFKPDKDYCSGFSSGYKSGFCYNEQFCTPPITPICPIPKIGKDTWDDGFSDGFVKGREDKGD